MISQDLTSVISAILLFFSAQVRANNGCEVIGPDSKADPMPSITISKSGSYCLDRSYKFICYPWMHSCSGVFIEIDADDVMLDMKGYSLRSFGTSAYDGIRIYGDRVHVKNGIVSGVGMAIRVVGGGGASPYTDLFDKGEAIRGSIAPGDVRVVNMDLSISGLLGPVLYAATRMLILESNTIRGTLLLTGDAHQVKDNKFEFRAPEPTPGGKNMFRYAVLARRANGLLFRRNTVQVTGSSENVTGVAIWESKEVQLLQNRVIGAEFPLDIYKSDIIRGE